MVDKLQYFSHVFHSAQIWLDTRGFLRGSPWDLEQLLPALWLPTLARHITLWVICPFFIVWGGSSFIWLPTLACSRLLRTVAKICICPQHKKTLVQSVFLLLILTQRQFIERRRLPRGPRKMCSSHPESIWTSNPFQEKYSTLHVTLNRGLFF